MKSCWTALRFAVLGATVAGCIKIPPFQGGGDAGGDGSDATGDGSMQDPAATATVVSGTIVASVPSLYQVAFSTEPYHFPFSMTVGTTSLIAGDNPECAGEYGVGVSLYPATRITGHQGTGVAQEDIHIDLAGPPVAKVSLDWATQFGCGGTNTGDATGRSTFTFFPDGHINRSEIVHIPAMLDGSMCTCSGTADNWHISSFLTVNRAVLNPTVIGAAVPTDNGAGIAVTQPTLCFTGNQNSFQFAMAWRSSGSTFRLRTPPTTGTGTLAFVYDLSSSTPSMTIGPNYDGEGQTTWWVGTTSNCSDLRTAVEPYSTGGTLPLPELNIASGNDPPTSYGVALDGIFGGENGQSTAGTGYPSNVVTLSPSGAPLGAFAFWIQLHNGADLQSVEKMPMTPQGTWYAVQTPPGHPNDRVFWFPDGLKSGESIVITGTQ